MKVNTIKMVLVDVSEKKMSLRMGQYGFIAYNGRRSVEIYVGRRSSTKIENILKIVIPRKAISNGLPQALSERLASSEDEFISTYANDIAQSLAQFIVGWKDLLRSREIEKILAVPIDEETTITDVEALKKVEFEKVLSVISSILSPKISELLEIVMTTALTLKQVDREKGVIDNRPVWLTIVADPSTYKTSTLKFLSESKRVFFAQNFTPASLLPANQDVEPLIAYMHNKVFIIPTLSEELADKDMTKKVFSALESVYDGEYAKSTGLSGLRKEIVDTVIIAAVTPAVWEWVLPYIVNIGSRWLVYRYLLNDDEALVIQKSLEQLKEMTVLRKYVSQYLDYLLDNTTYLHLKNVVISNEYEKELEILARLVSRLRAVWKIETYWETDEIGRKTPHKEVEILQVEAPSRAYQQLKNFVRANTFLRKSGVEKIVGIPIVDEHAMMLARKIAISSTTNKLKDIVLCIAEKQLKAEMVMYSDLTRATGLSRGSVENLIKILRHPRIDILEQDDFIIKEPFFSVIKKLFTGQQNA
ncbi:MAG: hypothetical protein QXW45_06900 [Thermosphaera sp.]